MTAEIAAGLNKVVNVSDIIAHLKTKDDMTLVEKAAFLKLLARTKEMDHANILAEDILAQQGEDGSFGGHIETAYAVRALAEYFSVASSRAGSRGMALLSTTSMRRPCSRAQRIEGPM